MVTSPDPDASLRSPRPSATPPYRGRLAPSPTGYLHLGHARTFWIAQERTRAHGGTLLLRNEDLDPDRCRPHFVAAFIEDLHWFGIQWQEGPDGGGPFAPYHQSQRTELHRAAFDRLRASGRVYPCTCSRKDVQRALQAPHLGDAEPVYPGTCRPRPDSDPHAPNTGEKQFASPPPESTARASSRRVNWRFRVSDGDVVSFVDGNLGPQQFMAGRDFGDFVVWRHDNLPSYQLSVVVDDAAMRITEVVRGADLLGSTARQLLLYRALGLCPPAFFHCPLLTDDAGVRLAKRHEALSLRQLRDQGEQPEALRQSATFATPDLTCGR